VKAPPPSDARIQLTFVLMKKRALDCGYPLSSDERVSEASAARLLHLHPGTLVRLRREGRAPPSYDLGVGGSRISYSLQDLCVWLESRREDF
jgi:hypothetical protein